MQSLELSLEDINELRDHVTGVAGGIVRDKHARDAPTTQETLETQEDSAFQSLVESFEYHNPMELEVGPQVASVHEDEASEAPEVDESAGAPMSTEVNDLHPACNHTPRIQKQYCLVKECNAPADVEVEDNGDYLYYCYYHEYVADRAVETSKHPEVRNVATQNNIAENQEATEV